jgi:hypothetical protein
MTSREIEQVIFVWMNYLKLQCEAMRRAQHREIEVPLLPWGKPSRLEE